MPRDRARLAFIVSHPIQYYAPLYQRLVRRGDIDVKVFFTWHADIQYADRGFARPIAWDLPLLQGYDYEVVPNTSSDPGPHHFSGFVNPTLVDRVAEWRPDAVHITGWAWRSHVGAMRAFHRRGVPTLFRGDSHLLDSKRRGPAWEVKRAVLTKVYSWASACLYVGRANRAYYEAFGVGADRLFHCPHSIDVARFAEPQAELEAEAAAWRRELCIAPDALVALFAGKFERKKQPVRLAEAVSELAAPRIVLIMLGGGELQDDIAAIANRQPERFRMLPFHNQTRMPVVYRLADVFMLPSAYGETWGLSVNEAFACGRPAIVSDRVGCAPDVVDNSCGRVIPWDEPAAIGRALVELEADRDTLRAMGKAASRRAWSFDIAVTESALLGCLERLL